MKAIYLRTSTEEQNPENQLKDCLSLSGGDVEVFKEKQSAWRDKDRPIFESIKERIKKGEIKELYVWDWDRLFRNRKKLKEFFEYCKLYKCDIHSFRQDWFESFYKIPEPFNEIMQELFLNLFGYLAEDESKKKSERVKIAFKNHKGKKWGRKAISNKIKEEILEAKKKGMSIREIADSVFIWDTNNNPKKISKSYVHKTIQESQVNIQS